MYACMHASIHPSIYHIENTYISQSLTPSRSFASSQSQKHHSITERLLHTVCTHLHTYYYMSLSFCSITEPDSITEFCSITEPKASLCHRAPTTYCMYTPTYIVLCPYHSALSQSLTPSRSFAPSQSQICTYICMYIPTCTLLCLPIILPELPQEHQVLLPSCTLHGASPCARTWAHTSRSLRLARRLPQHACICVLCICVCRKFQAKILEPESILHEKKKVNQKYYPQLAIFNNSKQNANFSHKICPRNMIPNRKEVSTQKCMFQQLLIASSCLRNAGLLVQVGNGR